MRTKTDREALDALALFMAHPGPWNGGDVCELAADLIGATGRPHPGDIDYLNNDASPGVEELMASPKYVEALAKFHAGDTKARIEILHVRDPDSECEHEVWLDGVKTDAYSVEDLDPGRGWVREDWDERILEAREDTSEFGQRVLAELESIGQNSKWIEDY